VLFGSAMQAPVRARARIERKITMKFKSQWSVYRTRFLVRARQLTEPLIFINAVGREQIGQPGDYLVEFSDGIRRTITQTLFEDVYVPVAQINGAPGVLPGTALPSTEDRRRANA
jgi:hypothetical protein